MNDSVYTNGWVPNPTSMHVNANEEELCDVVNFGTDVNNIDHKLNISNSQQESTEPKHVTAENSNSIRHEQTNVPRYSDAMHDVEPTSDEMDELLRSNPTMRNTRYVDQHTELFHSIPNLVYTRLDEQGNIVASETNMLRGDGVISELTHHEQSLCNLSCNSCNSSNNTHASSRSSLNSSSQLNDRSCAFVTQSYQDTSADNHSTRDFTRAHSQDTAEHRNGSAFNPRRSGGRHSRYTWYRSHPRSGILKRAVTSADSDVASFSLWSTSRREKAMLLCFALLNLSSMMCLGLLAPFFPKEAESKGVDATVLGWIFGSYALAQLFLSPVFGVLLRWVNAKFMFCSGMFFGGSCYAMFGAVYYIPASSGKNLVYITYCFLLRISASLGCTAASTASFALTAHAFSDHATSVFGLLETFSGIGLSLGPAIGGALYDLGGFVLPFYVLGFVMVAMVPASMYLLPADSIEDTQDDTRHSMTSLLRIPSILVTCLCITMGGLVWAMLDPILQPHLAPFHVSASTVGLFFLLMCSLYAICSPLWGKVCDRIDDSSPMMLLGLILSGLGLLLLGPSSTLGFPETYNALWLNIVALIVLGVAVSLAVIPTFDKMIDATEKAGLEENLELYGLIAGLWGAVYALGDFSGPVLSGFLTEKYGFRSCVTYVAYACGVMALVILCLWIWEKQCGPTQMLCSARDQASTNQSEETVNSDETRPLLEPTTC